MPTEHVQTVHDSHFPIGCPKCQRLAGMPYVAGTSVDTYRIIIGLRCRECRYEWKLEMPQELSDGTTILKPW